MLLLDATGAQRDQKNAGFTTSGNQPAAAPPVDATGTEAATDAPAEEAAERPQQ